MAAPQVKRNGRGDYLGREPMTRGLCPVDELVSASYRLAPVLLLTLPVSVFHDVGPEASGTCLFYRYITHRPLSWKRVRTDIVLKNNTISNTAVAGDTQEHAMPHERWRKRGYRVCIFFLRDAHTRKIQ